MKNFFVTHISGNKGIIFLALAVLGKTKTSDEFNTSHFYETFYSYVAFNTLRIFDFFTT